MLGRGNPFFYCWLRLLSGGDGSSQLQCTSVGFQGFGLRIIQAFGVSEHLGGWRLGLQTDEDPFFSCSVLVPAGIVGRAIASVSRFHQYA